MLIKTFKFFFCLVIMLCSACSSSDNPVDQEQEEDKYFFRYEVTCVSDSAQSIKKLYVITDNGNIITQMPEGKKTEWDATYGPVTKKCYIGLSCNDEDEKINTKFRVSGFFRLVTPYVRNKVVPLPYGTDQATTCHSSGCAYRQLRCCKF